MNEIDKAEYVQAIKAYLIPTSLFVACLIGAAGTFLIREGYFLGWGFVLASLAMIVAAMVAFVNFQNKLRANGKMKDQFDTFIADEAESEAPGSVGVPPASKIQNSKQMNEQSLKGA